MPTESFWKPNARGYLSPGASDEAFAAAERRPGLKLPQSIRETFRLQNGGNVARPVFQQAGATASTALRDSHYFGNDSFDRVEEFCLLTQLGDEGWDVDVEGLNRLVVVVRSGPRFWCLDYRDCGRSNEPSFTYINAESLDEIAVAPSWSAFREGLVARPRQRASLDDEN